MTGTPPTRPLGVDANEPPPGSVVTFVVWLAGLIAAMLALLLAPPSTGLAVVSALLTCVGAGLAAAGVVRTLRENHGRRVPWLGRPPVRPRRWDYLSGTGVPVTVYGAGVFGRAVGGATTGVVLPLALGAVLVLAMTAAQARHNRRVDAA